MTCKCEGCRIEIIECYNWQNTKGVVAGLESYKNHLFFFAIDEKTNKFIVPYYDPKDMKNFHKQMLINKYKEKKKNDNNTKIKD